MANNNDSKMTGVRQTTIARMEQIERYYKLAFLGGALLEIIFLSSFLLLADWTNRLHILLLISTMASYSILILGLIALGAKTSKDTLRILKAIELLDDSPAKTS